jgi:hypothetical protein
VHYSSLPQLSIFFENAERVNGLKQNVLTTLERPGQPWEVITLDLIEGLPCSANHDTTLAVVDNFFLQISSFYRSETSLSVLWMLQKHAWPIMCLQSTVYHGPLTVSLPLSLVSEPITTVGITEN